jgi:uncharacterized protein YbaP (TraB family)
MTFMSRRLGPILAALLAFIMAGAGPAWAKPPIWVAHGAHATVVLFGSVHILPSRMDWEPQTLKEALADADELWFEIPLDPADQMDAGRKALARGLLPEGQTLSALLPNAAARAKLTTVAEGLHLPMAQLDRLRPWLADLTLSAAAYAREGASADQGVERQLAQAAAPQAQRRAFETIDQQLAMFADAATSDQIASLMDTLHEIQDEPDLYRRLTDAWLKGDLKAIDREAVQPLRRSSPVLFRILLTDRNAAWRKTLLERLRGRGKVVVVVGVGHLVGAQGLPQLLRDSGVVVDGPRP